MEPKVPPQQNGSKDQAIYSDSEEEENEEEEDEEEEQPGILANYYSGSLTLFWDEQFLLNVLIRPIQYCSLLYILYGYDH